MADATARDLGEFGLIARVVERLGTAPQVLLGPGDDAAVVAAPDGRVVATTDVLVEGVHFRRDWSTAYDVGRKAAAANLADVAAMGGRGSALLVGLSAPADLPVDWALGLADGLRDEARRVGAVVVGGDTTTADRIVVSVTALGDLGGRPPVTRAGAAAGNVLVVVGRLGWSAAGLALLERGDASLLGRFEALVTAHLRPEPPYGAGPELAARGATAMCDLSDGLLGDLAHVLKASGVGAALSTPAVDEEVAEVAEALGLEVRDLVLRGGEDHALLAALPAGFALPPGAVQVGVCTEELGLTLDGQPVAPGAFDHFLG